MRHVTAVVLSASALVLALTLASVQRSPEPVRADGAAASPNAALEENNTGVAALERGDVETALDHLRSAHARDPVNAVVRTNLLRALNARAAAAQDAGRHDQAERAYREALALDPGDLPTQRQYAVFLNNRAVAFLEARRREDARACLQRALPYLDKSAYEDTVRQIKRNYSNLLAAEGDDLTLEQEYESARGRYEQALEFNPHNANAHAGLGDISYDRDAYAAALEHYRRALAAATTDGRTRLAADLVRRIDTLEKEMVIEADFLTIRDGSGRFQLFFPKSLPKGLVARVLAALNAAYVKIGADFDFHPMRPVTVKIYSRQQMDAIQEVPPWVMGYFDGKLRLLDTRLEDDARAMRRSIYHEYTHAIVHFLGGESVPSWLHEGLAQIEEPDRPVTDREIHYVAVRVRIGKAVALAEMTEPFERDAPGDEMPLIYMQSKLLVGYLLEHYGWETVRRVLRETARLDDFDTAFSTACGVTTAALEAEWKQWLLDRDGHE